MKNRLVLIIINVVLLLNVGCIKPQQNDKEVKKMLREFYVEYNTLWSSDIDFEDLEKELLILQKRNCTKKLQNKINDLYKIYGLDHDLILNDLYTDSSTLEKTLTIEKCTEKENSYVITYMVRIEEPSGEVIEKKAVINVRVMKEGEQYKLDDVW